jgi:hemerythrin
MTCPQGIFWSPSLEVGNAVLDSQHRHIVELINALYAASAGEGLETADVLIDHIGRFVQHHFEVEEAMLRKLGYRELEEHSAEHRRLLDCLRGAAGSVRSGRDTGEGLATAIWSWLHEHTATWDQDYADVLGSRRSSGR